MKYTKRNKYDDHYKMANNLFDEDDNEENENNSIDYGRMFRTVTVIILFSIALFFLAILFYFEGYPMKVLDSNTKKMCESKHQDEETIEEILDVFEDNGYDRYQIEKVVYDYVSSSSAESESIYVYFKESNSDEWKYIKEGMSLKWNFSKELEEKIKETE